MVFLLSLRGSGPRGPEFSLSYIVGRPLPAVNPDEQVENEQRLLDARRTRELLTQMFEPRAAADVAPGAGEGVGTRTGSGRGTWHGRAGERAYPPGANRTGGRGPR
jgi:hypothetical protein